MQAAKTKTREYKLDRWTSNLLLLSNGSKYFEVEKFSLGSFQGISHDLQVQFIWMEVFKFSTWQSILISKRQEISKRHAPAGKTFWGKFAAIFRTIFFSFLSRAKARA